MPARIALLAFAFVPLSLAAQTLPGPFEEEAPEALFDLQVSDADVSLYAAGTGTTGIAPALGWTFALDPAARSGSADRRVFPGLESIPFSFDPNLTISLWLLQRYFFETTVPEDLRNATFLLGYAGRAGESVQSVLVGNTAIGMGAYPYLGFGDETGAIGQDAPGASALFGTPTSSHELMIRFSPTEAQEIRYADGGIVGETRVPASSYARNTSFVLPDGGLDFLEVYVEAANGSIAAADGRRYRRVDLARETRFSLADGTIAFDEPPDGRTLVYYEVGGVPVGDASLGRSSLFALDNAGNPNPADARDFRYVADGDGYAVGGDYLDALVGTGQAASQVDPGDFVVRVGDDYAFLIHDPGRYAPFASAAEYATGAADATSITVEAPGAARRVPGLSVVPVADDGTVRVVAAGAAVRSYAYRYPFASAEAAPLPELYGPAARPEPNEPAIVVRRVNPTAEIVLPSGFVPGSVRITRNGVSERGFVVTDSGRVVFDRELSDTDVVRVAFRTRGSGQAGDFVFGSGNTFALAPGTDAGLALGARWKPVGARFSTVPGEYPGRLTLSGSVATRSSGWERATVGELSAGIDAAVSLASPDTSGVLRLAGMNDGGRSLPIATGEVFASAPPVADPDGDSPVDPIDPASLTAATRGELLYRDYVETNALGERVLLPYPTDDPLDPVAGRVGPYVANSLDDQYAGTVAVLDYRIDGAAGRRWTAGVVRVDGGVGVDLSDARRLSVPYRVIERIGDVRVFVQLGATGEDLDADGSLDAGIGALPFGGEATGTIPVAGTRYTEDANANGVLDRELPDLVFSHELTELAVPSADDEAPWVIPEIALTAAQARRLAETRAVRFLVYSDAAGEVSGRLAFGSLRTDGTSFSVAYARSAPDAPAVSVGERDEPDDGAAPFATVFPEVASILHANEPTGRLLAAEWSGLGTGTIALTRATSVPVADYGELRLYYRLPWSAPDGVEVTARLLAGEETVAESTAVASSVVWRELVVPLPVDPGAIATSVRIELAGPDAGALFLDEVSLWAPRTSVDVEAGLAASWSPGTTLTVGTTTVVSGVTVEQRIAAQATAFPDGTSARAGVDASSDVRATVLGASTAAGVDFAANPSGTGLQVRHRLRVPFAPALVVGDEFRVGYDALEPGSTHASSVSVALGRSAAVAARWLSDQRETGRVTWSAEATATVARPGSGSTEARQEEAESVGSPPERRAGGAAVLDVSASVELGEERPTRSTPGPYPVSWVRSFADVVPATSPDARSGDAAVAAAIDLGRIGLELAASSSFAADAVSGRRVTGAVVGLSAPLPVGDASELVLAMTREYELTTQGAPQPTPADDVSTSARLLSDHPLVFAFWPGEALVAPDYPSRSETLTSGLLAASYRPGASVEFTRRISSSPWSLLLPTSVGASLARPAEREQDAFASRYEAGADAAFVAPNLFGRLGSAPVFRFYDTDEFQSGVAIEITDDGAERTTEVSYDARVRLLWNAGASLSSQTVVTTLANPDREPRATASLVWERPADGIPLPARLEPAVRSRERTTTLEFDYSAGTDTALYGRLVHAAALAIGEGGMIRLHGGLGLGSERVGDERFGLFGLRFGVEGELRR